MIVPGWISGPSYRIAPLDASPLTCWLIRDYRTTAMERARACVRMFAAEIEAEARARDRQREAPLTPPAKSAALAVPRPDTRKPAGTVRRGRTVYQVDKRGKLILVSPRGRAQAALSS
jgi:hypothetical protein